MSCIKPTTHFAVIRYTIVEKASELTATWNLSNKEKVVDSILKIFTNQIQVGRPVLKSFFNLNTYLIDWLNF